MKPKSCSDFSQQDAGEGKPGCSQSMLMAHQVRLVWWSRKSPGLRGADLRAVLAGTPAHCLNLAMLIQFSTPGGSLCHTYLPASMLSLTRTRNAGQSSQPHPIDVWDHVALGCGGHPVHCRMLSCSPGLCSLDASGVLQS